MDPETGEFVLAKDLSTVCSINSNTKCLSIEKVTRFIDSGQQECFEITTSNGFKTTTTAKHRYLTKTGWKRLDQISIGEEIAQPSCLKYKAFDNSVSFNQGLFLGLMIGDGNYTQTRPMFVGDDPILLTKIKDLAQEIFGSNIQTPIYATRDNNPNYESIGFTQKDWKTKRDIHGYCLPNPIINWLKLLGIYGNEAHSK